MSAVVTTEMFGVSGVTRCNYIVTVCFPGKEPFWVQSFKVPRHKTQQETEAAALREAEREIASFAAKHFPDGFGAPVVLKIELGVMTFIPDDYEWRRA